jgi:endonuclease/exonuclease/phosphatase family metal-dependent hydrolase
VRTITYNVYGCTGWPDGADGAASVGRETVAARTAAALAARDPDVVTFSEAPPEPVVREMAAEVGMDAAVFPSRGHYPGALLTDCPLVAAESVPDLLDDPPDDLFTRHAGRAVVETGDGELVVYSVHLHPGDEGIRLRESRRLGTAVEADVRSGRPVVLQGDLNHTPDGPECEAWRAAGLRDAHALADADPDPTFRTDDPDMRIDYVWVSEAFADRTAAARVLSGRPFGPGASDDYSLSDHLPVLATFDCDR